MNDESSPLHFTDTGKGAPIVLLHPVGLDHSFWGPLPERLASTRRVIAPDLPGHGQSPRLGPGADMAAYAAAVAGLMDDLSVDDATVLGLSFGGMIAQELAIRHPRRVGSLILCGCASRVPADASATLKARGTKALDGGMATVVDETMTRWFTTGFIGLEAALDARKRLLTDDAQGWADGWAAISGFNAEDRLAALRIPALVIAGERDAATSPDATRRLASLIPGAQFAMIAQAPHMMQIETADAFADAVAGYLAQEAGQ